MRILEERADDQRKLEFKSIEEFELLIFALDAGMRHESWIKRRKLRSIGMRAIERTRDGSRAGNYQDFAVEGDEVGLVLDSYRYFVQEKTEKPPLSNLKKYMLGQALEFLDLHMIVETDPVDRRDS